ncbi:sugar ABC transporter permease [Paenibacillus sambharensis]|uniref:Sugar ABC transporter permease n=1 Tax=Paenibacillus sambharensis TaxID=1803190 RepID=A0A2W1LM23_9BACL|nr:sugar ABC transporter permease [Paenibacillus sambharensis]
MFFLPGLVLYLAVFVYPTLSGLYYSFTDWDGLSPSHRFVGLDNYLRLAEHIVFQKALVNNLKFMAAVVFCQTILSLVLALYLQRSTHVNAALRSLYFIPAILSSVSVGFIWTFIYDPSFGMLNNLLESAGLSSWSRNWLGDAGIAIYAVAGVQAWAHIGQMVILFVAGLQAIPADLLESAKLDGGTRWQVFRHVTWPLLAPAAALVVSYTTIQSFKAFDLVFTMTGGGPNYSTEILSTFIYGTAFSSFKFGFAAAASCVFLLLIAVITFLQFKALRTERVTY